jgi:hypothetical protein
VTDSGNRYEPNRSQNRQKTTILGVLRSLPFSGCFPSVVLVRKLQFLVFKYIGVPTHFSSFFDKNLVSQVVVQKGGKNDPLFGPQSSQTGTLYFKNWGTLPDGPGRPFFPEFPGFWTNFQNFSNTKKSGKKAKRGTLYFKTALSKTSKSHGKSHNFHLVLSTFFRNP